MATSRRSNDEIDNSIDSFGRQIFAIFFVTRRSRINGYASLSFDFAQDPELNRRARAAKLSKICFCQIDGICETEDLCCSIFLRLLECFTSAGLLSDLRRSN